MTASSEPTGSKFINISAPDSFKSLMTFSESSVGSIMSSTNLPIPSRTFPGFTFTPKLGTSANFTVLFGSSNIASDKSFPTFDLLISNAQTTSISETR